MASFKVVLAADAETDFRSVPFPFRRQFNGRIVRLKSDPHPADEEILDAGRCRLSVHGRHVLYNVDEAERIVTILAVVKE